MLAVMQPKNYLMHGLGVGGGRGRPKGSRNGYISPGAAYMKNYDIVGERADPNQSSKKNEIKRDVAKTQAAKNEAMNDRSAMQYTNPSRLPGVSSNSSSGKAPSSQTGSQSSVVGTSVPYEGTNAPLSRDAAEKVSELKEAAAEESYQGKDFFGRLLQNPGRALSEAWNQGVSWLRGVGKRITDFGKAAWDKIVSGATAIGNAAKQGYNAAKDFVGNAANQAGKWVGNAANDARNFVMGTPTTTSVTTFDENGRAVPGVGKVNYGGVFGRGGFVDQAGRQIQDFGNDLGYNLSSLAGRAKEWGQNAINDVGEAAGNFIWGTPDKASVAFPIADEDGRVSSRPELPGYDKSVGRVYDQRYGGLLGRGGLYEQLSRGVRNAGYDIGNAATNAYNDASNWVQNQALPWAQQAGRDIGNAAASAYDAVSAPVSRAANSIGAYLAERPANQLPQEASLMQGSRIVDPDTGRIGNGFTVPDGNGGYTVGIYYPDTRTFRYLDQNDIYGRGR